MKCPHRGAEIHWAKRAVLKPGKLLADELEKAIGQLGLG